MAELSAVMNPPIMPHLDCDTDELDMVYPAIEVPPEVDDEVPENDWTLDEGMKVAGQIIEQANTAGRRRAQKG